jgi:class I fructose-bisphosphate aldolase
MKEKIEEVKSRIMPNDKAMILAYDQGFEHGPRDFLVHPECSNFEYILDIAQKGKFTGLVLHAGLAEKYVGEIADSGVPLILKLNGKSELFTEEDPFSPQLYSVEDAITLGAIAVGYTVYSGSKYENEMLGEFSKIVREAHSKGMMAIGWMYPRGKAIFDRKSSSKTLKMALDEQEQTNQAIDETPSIVAYGARIGLELGADMVKVKYTGSPDSFRWVVKSAHPTRVVMSGGPKTITDEEFLSRVKDVIDAGAAGIAVGRNVWQRSDPLSISKKLHQLIYGD